MFRDAAIRHTDSVATFATYKHNNSRRDLRSTSMAHKLARKEGTYDNVKKLKLPANLRIRHKNM
jgi:hypothetical protein